MNKHKILFVKKETSHYLFSEKILKSFHSTNITNPETILEIISQTQEPKLLLIESDLLNKDLWYKIRELEPNMLCLLMFEEVVRWEKFAPYLDLGVQDFLHQKTSEDEAVLRLQMVIHRNLSPLNRLKYHVSLSKEILEERLIAQDKILHNAASIVMTDIEGRITYANDNFYRMSQYTVEEAIGKTHALINSGKHPQEFFAQMWETIQKGEIWHGEICNRKKDGSLYWVDTSIIPILGEQNRPQQYLALRFDITEYKELEIELKAQKDELLELNMVKDKMFSIISHDFRSPLRSLQGVLHLLSLQEITAQETQQLAQELNEKVNYTLTLLENLLHWAKAQMEKGMEIEPENMPLHKVFKSNLQIFEYQAQKKGINLSCEVDEKLWVYADPNMLDAILRNLISNAIKFTNIGGSVHLAVLRENTTFVEISVRDTGIGIENHNLKKIFRKQEHFTTLGTAQERGTGLGLQLIQDFVRRNDGEIRVESTVGKGSNFIFSIPKGKPEKNSYL